MTLSSKIFKCDPTEKVPFTPRPIKAGTGQKDKKVSRKLGRVNEIRTHKVRGRNGAVHNMKNLIG